MDVIIFGAGKAGNEAYKYLSSLNYSVIAFADNNKNLVDREVCGVKVISPTTLKAFGEAIIIICAPYEEVAEQLSKMGIENYYSYKYFKLQHEHQMQNHEKISMTSVQLACNWLLKNLDKGRLKVVQNEERYYPEVTGYTIPTMLNYGFRKEAEEMADWLISIQQPNGAFLDSYEEKEYYFDSAQVLRGLNALSQITDKYMKEQKKLAEYLFNTLIQNDYVFPPQYENDELIPETIHLFSLAPMLEYAKKINHKAYQNAIHKAVQKYLCFDNVMQMNTLTHFLAYQIDALIDMGYETKVKDIIDHILDTQRQSGLIVGMEGVEWYCLTGMAQIAICFYKLKIKKPADKIMQCLEHYQQTSGGFLGSTGKEPEYFGYHEISWAVKFYLDAYQYRIRSFFDEWEKEAPIELSLSDGRFIEISAKIKNGDNVCEIGCGKGRFINNLIKVFESVSITGVDISEKMLANLPIQVKKVQANSEYLPIEDNIYDVVYSVEAIEHSVNLSAAVSEMVRICKPGGWIIVIDKQMSQWGRFVCPPWELWPDRIEFENILKQYCETVKSQPVMYDDCDRKDELMICWQGVKKR